MPRSPYRRPTFLNLALIQLPVGAFTSITHRVTGVLLALGVPWLVYLLELSLRGAQSYAHVTALFESWPLRGINIVLTWALAHHAFAGLRHLLADMGIGSALIQARRSAWLINVGALVVAVLLTGALY